MYYVHISGQLYFAMQFHTTENMYHK